MSSNPILYLGDNYLQTAAGYLAGLMTLWKFGFDHVNSEARIPDDVLDAPRKLIILSDYPAKLLPKARQEKLLKQVEAGTGLIMIGGWESFCGQGGHWAGTPLGDALPVHIETADDRINCAQPAILLKVTEHPSIGSLPWTEEPPLVGGFNRFTPKPDATSVLDVQRYSAQWHGEKLQMLPTERHPMLVVGTYRNARTAALATDIAPHWVGGLIDWGSVRVTAAAVGGWQCEVGAFYATFLRNLLSWTGKLEES